MRILLAAAAAFALAACSESPPPPKPKAAPPKAAEAPKPPPPPVAETKPEPPKPDPNKELAARVKQTLEAPQSKLPSGAIDVTAADGKVSLWGAVASEAQRRRAADIARKIEGVTSVDNQLKVVRGS
jgi:outer membrane biosynthesis protein TonB